MGGWLQESTHTQWQAQHTGAQQQLIEDKDISITGECLLLMGLAASCPAFLAQVGGCSSCPTSCPGVLAGQLSGLPSERHA
jgi:hypothetical protein